VRKLLAVLAVLALVGCTKSDRNPNILHFSALEKIKGMDPALSQDLYSGNEVSRVYETLLEYHEFKRPYVLQPLLAESMPVISKDGLTYTFKVRKGVRFHDDAAFPEGKGREMKAKDVEYSLKRLADPRVQSTGWWVLDGRIKGLNEFRDKYTKEGSGPTNYDDVVEGLRATDDYTIELKLLKPYPQLLNVLAMPYGSVVAKEAVDKYGKEFINHAVGTGPFVLTSYNPNDRLIYKKNPNYWEAYYPSEGEAGDKEAGLLADAGKRLPFADGVEVRVIVEDQPRWLHLMRGDLDLGGVPKDNFGTAVGARDASKPLTYDNLQLSPEVTEKGITLSTTVEADFTYTAFNVESKEIPQFADKRVRQAISLALDNKDSIRLFYNNMATSAQTPIPPGIAGYDPSFVNPYRTGDLEKARKLLADAGYPGGKGFPEIPYDSLANTTSRQMADYAVKQLAQLGLKVNVVSGTWPQLLERVQRRQTQLWGIAWLADYPDAENFLQLFYGPNAQPGGMNASYYKNKDYDRLFEQARTMSDSPARTEIYKRLARMIAEDTPVVLGVHRLSLWLKQPWIRNFKVNSFHTNRAKYLRVDLEAKKKYGK
jgi:oligopeptide transport system substrate-binding protein